MVSQVQEQLRHDTVNLSIIVRNLEQSARGQKWEQVDEKDRDLKWLEAQTILAVSAMCTRYCTST